MSNRPIMIVDGDSPVLTGVASLLKINGYQHVIMSKSARTIEIAASRNPALIIMDTNATSWDGNSLCHSLQNSTYTRDIPVLVLSDSNKMADVHRSLKDGAASYLKAPYDPTVLLQEVRRLKANRMPPSANPVPTLIGAGQNGHETVACR